MKQTSLLLFSILLGLLNSQNIYTKEDVFNYFNSIDIPEETLDSVKNVIADTFEKLYAFNEILKNPPQPEFDNNYFEKLDFQEKIKSINTKNTNFYTFYQELMKILAIIGDLHISIDFDSNFDKIGFIPPITFILKKVDEKPKIFSTLNMLISQFFNIIPNFDKIQEIITKNSNVSIKYINGEDPFDFISNFGNDYSKLKGPHGNFRWKYHIISNGYDFQKFPFSMDELADLSIEFENGEKLSIEYIYMSPLNLTSLETKDITKKNIKNFITKFKDKKNLDKGFIQNELFKYNKKFFEKFKININQNNDLSPDVIFENFFFCKVDNKNQLNTFVISSFYPKDSKEKDKFEKEMFKCIDLFDNNNYPIAVLMVFNAGGWVDLSNSLLELISSKYTFNVYGAMRKTEIFNDPNIFDILKDFYFRDYENGEKINSTNFAEKQFEINYGDNIKDNYYGPYILLGQIREILNNYKKKIKNKRNPTDILVYTDGFSYSAAAIFIKYLNYNGGGITSGYFLNPNLENKTFDMGLSPSPIIKYMWYIGESKNTITIQVPLVQTFYNPYNLTCPLEYEITPVDEMSNLYFFSFDDEEEYNQYVNNSLKIFEKYRNYCNPKNKKLVFVTDKCDGKFKSSYTHGGYLCGDDGKWTETCVPSYCDIGYIFDHINQECIVDVCSEQSNSQDDEPSGNDSKSYFKTVILIVVPVIIAIILIILLIICIKRRKKNNKEIESVNKENLTEGLNV